MRKEPDLQRRRLLAAGLATLPLAATNSLAATSQTPSRRIKLAAKPEPIELDAAHTSVIVVDMQNDFGAKGGMFERAGIDISGIRKAVAPTARVLAAARSAGIRIIYLKMGYRPDLSDLGAHDSVNRTRHLRLKVGERVRAPDGSESRILVRDTWNTAILDELKPGDGDRHGLHDQRLRRIHRARCDVPGLPARAAVGLHERAHRWRSGPQQP